MEYILLKISGGLTDEPEQMSALAQHCSFLLSVGKMPVIVHGGGKQINALSEKLGIPVQQVDGRRITSSVDLDVLLYVVGGSVNRGLVHTLRNHGINAVGLTGIDGMLTTATRRAPLRIRGQEIDFGLVGEMEAVNPDVVEHLAQKHMVSVIGCVTWSPEEGPLNINADTFAIELALALNAISLVFLMEPEALWDAQKQAMETVTQKLFDEGVQAGWIKEGMIPKVQTGFKAKKKAPQMDIRMTNPTGLLQQKGTRFI